MGIAFVNNFAPQWVELTNGKKVFFKFSKEVFDDQGTIDELRFLQASGVPIFECREMTQAEIEAERAAKSLEEITALTEAKHIEAAEVSQAALRREWRKAARAESHMMKSFGTTREQSLRKWPTPKPPAPPTRRQIVEEQMRITNDLYKDGKITAEEFAHRDLISRSTLDEIDLDVPPIVHNGREFSGPELTEYLERKKA